MMDLRSCKEEPEGNTLVSMSIPRLAAYMLCAGLSLLATVAYADVDLNGHFVGTASLENAEASCQVDVAETGGVLTLSGTCAGFIGFSGGGTIDVQTGALTLTTAVQGYCASVVTTGHADATGYSFSGSGSGCGMSGFFNFSRCGNGVLDPGEDAACESAFALGTSAFCCTGKCTLMSAGTACYAPPPNGAYACWYEACTGSDAACQSFLNPDGTA